MNRLLAGALLVLFLFPLSAAAEDWESVGEIDGVKVWKKSVEGSGLLAFRGEVTADVSVGQIMAVFTNPKKRKDWVARFRDSKNLETGPGFAEYWIAFNAPFPVSNRDYVLRSEGFPDPDARVYVSKIKSITRKDTPEHDCCVRADVTRTYYRFEALRGEKPRVKMTVEVHMDPQGMLPNWLINMIQKKWPADTLNGLVREAKKAKLTGVTFSSVRTK